MADDRLPSGAGPWNVRQTSRCTRALAGLQLGFLIRTAKKPLAKNGLIGFLNVDGSRSNRRRTRPVELAWRRGSPGTSRHSSAVGSGGLSTRAAWVGKWG